MEHQVTVWSGARANVLRSGQSGSLQWLSRSCPRWDSSPFALSSVSVLHLEGTAGRKMKETGQGGKG